MRVIIDRFEGDYAIVELPDRTYVDMPKILLEDAKEQDIINILVDKEETIERKKSIKSLMDKLFNDN